MQREPVIYTTAFTSLVIALFTIAALFGLDVSGETQEKIMTAGASIIGALVVLTPLIRQLVYSPASAKQIERGAQPAPMDVAPPHPIP